MAIQWEVAAEGLLDWLAKLQSMELALVGKGFQKTGLGSFTVPSINSVKSELVSTMCSSPEKGDPDGESSIL